MGTTIFKLQTEEAQAVRGFLKVAAAAKKAGKEVKVLVQQGKKLKRVKPDVRLGQIGSALGIGAGGAAVNQVISRSISLMKELFEGQRRVVDETGQAAIKLDDMLRPVAALGDNATRMKELRKEFFQFAIGAQIVGEKVAGGMFIAESGLGKFEGAAKDAIKQQAALQTLFGADFQTQVKAGVKLWAQFGPVFKEQGKDAGDLMGKLQKIADLSVASAPEVAQFGIRPLIAGGQQGFQFEEVGGAFPKATKLRGSAQRGLTGLATFIDKMDRAEDVLEIKLRGGFIDRLEQIAVAAGGSLDKFEEIFGNELRAFAKGLAENSVEIRAKFREIQAADKTEAQKKLNKIRSDPQSTQTEILKIAEAGIKNIRAFNASNPELLEQAIRFNAIRLGARMTSSPFLESTTEQLRLFQSQALGGGQLPQSARDALKFLEKQARGAGNVGAADIIAIQRGFAVPGLLARGTPSGRSRGELSAATTATQAGIGDRPNLFVQAFSKRLAKDPTFTKEKFVEELRRSPAKFAALSGFRPAEIRAFKDPTQTSLGIFANELEETIRADSPEAINRGSPTGKNQADQTAQAVKQAVDTRNPNAHD